MFTLRKKIIEMKIFKIDLCLRCQNFIEMEMFEFGLGLHCGNTFGHILGY